MNIFSNLFKATTLLARGGITLCGIYTFFGYFYAKEIKHRLGDTSICDEIYHNELKKIFRISPETSPPLQFSLYMSLKDLIVFYSRLWHYRQFQKNCKQFHKNVISSVLCNYEQYGVFSNMPKMQDDIRNNQLDEWLLKRILEVKILNITLTGLFGEEYQKIWKGQQEMRTGALLGLNEEEKYKINLAFNYIEKGEKIAFESQAKYLEYKNIQASTKVHQYPTDLFKILFI